VMDLAGREVRGLRKHLYKSRTEAEAAVAVAGAAFVAPAVSLLGLFAARADGAELQTKKY
jgi:hypothetical protein